jgi:hypothetical protein
MEQMIVRPDFATRRSTLIRFLAPLESSLRTQCLNVSTDHGWVHTQRYRRSTIHTD